MHAHHLGLKLLAALAVCSSSAGCTDNRVTQAACEPLAARVEAIELSDDLAIGRTQQGTIVVVDHSEERLFLSQSDSLQRYDVAGSGSSNADGAATWSYSVTDIEPPLKVTVERRGSGLRIKFYQAGDALDTKSLDFEAAKGDELEILDESAIEALTVRNLAGEVEVEYFARAGDDRLVAIRPKHDFDEGDLRLFFGASNAVMEREISEFTRYRDGGSTRIVFDLDGAEATVFFPSRLQSDGPPITEPVTFEAAGQARSIEHASADDAELDDLHFKCKP